MQNLEHLRKIMRRKRALSTTYERVVRPIIHWKADAAIVMMRGSGSTWFQTLLKKVLSDRARKPFTKPLWGYSNKRTPFMYFNTTDGSKYPRQSPESIVGKYVNKRVVLLVRDPRDILVSRYHWLKEGKQQSSPDLDVFLESKREPLALIIATMNA